MSVSPRNHRLVSVVCPGPPQKQTAELSFCFWLSEMSPSLLDWGWSGVIHFALLHPKWLLFVLRLRDNGAEMASGQWWHTSLSVRIQSRLVSPGATKSHAVQESGGYWRVSASPCIQLDTHHHLWLSDIGCLFRHPLTALGDWSGLV